MDHHDHDHDHDVGHSHHRSEEIPAPQSLHETPQIDLTLPADTTLITEPGTSGRGNTPVRTASVQRMQRAYGNQVVQQWLTGRTRSMPKSFGERAVQRWQSGVHIQRSADAADGGVSTGAVSIQRQEAEEEQEIAIPDGEMTKEAEAEHGPCDCHSCNPPIDEANTVPVSRTASSQAGTVFISRNGGKTPKPAPTEYKIK